MKTHPQNELKVLEAVQSGEWSIDQQGRIWRVKLRSGSRWSGGIRLTPCEPRRVERETLGGYLQVKLVKDGQAICAAAHRLVWIHTKGVIPQGMTVNHKNGVKADNRLENLELATYSEQKRHSFRVLGEKHADVKGDKHPQRVLSSLDIPVIRARRQAGESAAKIAKDYKVHRDTIQAACDGRSWKHLP